MRSFVPERRGQVQLAVLIGALSLLVGALAGLDALAEPAGIAFAAAAVLFWVNLVGAWRRYRNALRLLAEPAGPAA
jgi:uncharacterized membrane protein